MREANLAEASLRNADLSNADLTGTLYTDDTVFLERFAISDVMVQAKMIEGYLIKPDADLRNADLSDAN